MAIGDKYKYYIERYPYNVIPQKKSEQVDARRAWDLAPPRNDSIQSIIFDNNTLSIVHGYTLKTRFELNNFFENIANYIEMEAIIKKASTKNINISTIENNNDGIKFIAILPLYLNTNLEQDKWKMRIKLNNDENKILSLGRIFIYSTTENNKLRAIELFNDTDEDITVKILIGN